MHMIRFQVRGKGIFPIDMLRHQQCYPANTEAAAAMEDHFYDEHNPHITRGLRTVLLETCKDSSYWTPEGYQVVGDDRWASFGWTILEDVHGSTTATEFNDPLWDLRNQYVAVSA